MKTVPRPHQIDYEDLPTTRSYDSSAIARSVSLNERDFLSIAKIPPLHEILPPAILMPKEGVIDFSEELGLDRPATLPDLLAGNIIIPPEVSKTVGEGAGGLVMLILSGNGDLVGADQHVSLRPGDIACLPGNQGINVRAGEDGLSYFFVDDSPLLQYLGWQVTPNQRTALIHFPAELLKQKLDEYEADGIDASGVFLSHAGLSQEKLCTPHLFVHLNRLMPGARNIVHSHAAPALTYVIHGGNNCYSLIGETTVNGKIQNPVRVDWFTGQLSITPPNLWHGHFNEGSEAILSLVVQPAGLYYNARSMNFRFAD